MSSDSVRTCPECGQVSAKDKRVCFGCGYIFEGEGGRKRLVSKPAPPSSTGELVKLAKPLIITAVVLVGLMVLALPAILKWYARPHADREIERVVSKHLGKQKSHAQWVVRADNGRCTIGFTMPIPLVDAEPLAQEVAKRYSELRLHYHDGNQAVAEVYLMRLMMAQAVAENGQLVSSSTDLSVGRPANAPGIR